MRGDFKARFVGDTVTRERPIGQNIGSVRIKAAQNVELEGAGSCVQGPEILGRARVAEQEAIVLHQGLGRVGCAMFGQVVGRGNEGARHIGEFALFEGAVGRGAKHEGDVEAVFQEVNLAV